MTGTEIINAAFYEIGAFAPGNDPPTDDSAFVLQKLNLLLDSWATLRRFIYVISQASYTFGVSQQSYSIGPSGADFTAPRPVSIDRANLILTANSPYIHIQLDCINTHEYAALSVPSLSAQFPSRLYYQDTFPNGTLWPWPYPTDTANKLELFTWLALTEITNVATDYPLPPGYRKAIVLSLAEDLIVPYGKASTANLAQLQLNARKAREAIASINSAPPNMDVSMGDSVGIPGYSRSNFLTGGFG